MWAIRWHRDGWTSYYGGGEPLWCDKIEDAETWESYSEVELVYRRLHRLMEWVNPGLRLTIINVRVTEEG